MADRDPDPDLLNFLYGSLNVALKKKLLKLPFFFKKKSFFFQEKLFLSKKTFTFYVDTNCQG